MAFLSGMDISTSALTAQRLRMDVIAQNVANIDTTRTEEGGAYRRQYLVFEEDDRNFSEVFGAKFLENGSGGGGVRVAEVGEDQADFKLEYDPTHPDANEDGYVEYPNVDLVQEMTDFMSAYRSYEANVTAFNAYKDMAVKTLEIGK